MKQLMSMLGLLFLTKTILAYNVEYRDTVIVKNSTLQLVFGFENFECGINTYKHPSNMIVSNINYNAALDTAIYTYKPKTDFIGIDTAIFITGCGSLPYNMLTDTIEYIIKVSGQKDIVYYYNESQCSDVWQTGQNSTINEKKAAVKQFLIHNKIELDTVEITSVYGLGEDCEACSCLSGNRYYVTSADFNCFRMSELGFSIFIDSLSNPNNTRLSYIETQCSDPWHGEFINEMQPTPQLRLYELAQYLDQEGFSFVSLEIMPTIDVDLCLACNCRTGYRYDIIVNNRFVDQLKELGFIEMCTPKAGFTFSIFLSNPIQLDLVSIATNADSIVWKGISKYSHSDTIIGTGNAIRIRNLNNFVVIAYDCMPPSCPNTTAIKQIVFNSCGNDSVTIDVPVDNSTLTDSKSRYNLLLYPNPTNGNISFKGISNEKQLQYLILDSNGRKLKQGAIEPELYLNLSGGIYFLLISDKDRIVKREKIIVKNYP
jgi:hypothetical protein